MPLRPPSRQGAIIVNPLGLIFRFDVTLSENYGNSMAWTRFPVEGGEPEISDHADRQLEVISLSGYVTDTPLDDPTALPERSSTSRQTLVDIMNARLPVVVITGLGVFTSFVVTSVSTPRTPASGKGLIISVELLELRTVVAIEVAIPPELLKPKVENSGQSTGDAGTQAATDVAMDEEPSDILGLDIPPERDVTQSLLASGLDLAAEFDFTGVGGATP